MKASALPTAAAASASTSLFLLLYIVFLYNGCNLEAEAAILRRGNPLSWAHAKPHLNQVRRAGVAQFIRHYQCVKHVQTPKFLWGDEIEYGVLNYNPSMHSYEISPRATELLARLVKQQSKDNSEGDEIAWQPEYGSWMIEAVPGKPYDESDCSLLSVELSMHNRRRQLHRALSPNEIAPSTSNFPMMGVEGLKGNRRGSSEIPIEPPACINISGSIDTAVRPDFDAHANMITRSRYVDDLVINPHPRFTTLTDNIRTRRGKVVNITIPGETEGSDPIHMDAMAFGMGCCCLQVTMQCANDRQSRYLHDQLAVVAPLFLALSASTPIHKGRLAGTDTRWEAISQSVDDRRENEQADSEEQTMQRPDLELVGRGERKLSKSRYSSVSRFICPPKNEAEASALCGLNDIDAELDDEILEQVKAGGLDEALAGHLAHLFTRDPLVIFDDALPALQDPLIEAQESPSLDHFENIQSTNWRTIRWKPPSIEYQLETCSNTKQQQGENAHRVAIPENDSEGPNNNPGWRVEFRPLEVQLTDFENAAYAITVVLLSKLLIGDYETSKRGNFYIPMSLVEENMRRSKAKDAVSTQKFYFNKRAFADLQSPSEAQAQAGVKSLDAVCFPQEPGDIVEMSLDEVFNGKDLEDGTRFRGIIPAILGSLSSSHTSDYLLCRLRPYLQLLQKRASGELPTAAQWIRKYVKTHPAYKIKQSTLTSASGSSDDEVPLAAARDLLALCDEVGMGTVKYLPDLLGPGVPTVSEEVAHFVPSGTKDLLRPCVDSLSSREQTNTLGTTSEHQHYSYMAKKPCCSG